MKTQKLLPSIFCLAALALLSNACNAQPPSVTPRPTHASSTPPPTPASIHPLGEQVTLTIGALSLEPVRVVSPWQYEYSLATRRFVVQETWVRENDADGMEIWSIQSPDASPLRWLTASDHTAYLTTQSNTLREEPATVLHRLDVDTRQWLPPINLPSAGASDQEIETIVAALADDSLFFVLSVIVNDETVVSYRVHAYEHRAQEPLWARTFEWAGTREQAEAFLWAARTPNVTVPRPVPLTRLDESLIVCAGEQQDIISLNRTTGEETWRVERVWEYARGFIGPSVWSYYIDRFGQDWSWQEDESSLTEARKQFDDQFSCAIVGGPIIVPYTPTNRDEPTEYSLFIAVARSGNDMLFGQVASYVDECIVYELRTYEKSVLPISMATIPRMIHAWQVQTTPNGVVWAADNNSMVRLAPAPYDASASLPSMGRFGYPDLVTNIEWYRQFAPSEADVWLTADPASDAVAFAEHFAFRPLGGGYIASQGDSVYHFPLAMIDLQSGVANVLLLNVPYVGEVAEPLENASRWDDHFQVLGPYLLGVPWLEARGTTLRIVLGTETTLTAVDFEIGDMIESSE